MSTKHLPKELTFQRTHTPRKHKHVAAIKSSSANIEVEIQQNLSRTPDQHINHPCQRTNRPRNRTRLDPFFWATLYRLVHYLCPLYRQDCGYSTTCNSSLSELFSHPLEQFHPIPRNPSSPRFGSSSFPCPLYVIFSHPSVPSSVPLSPIGSPY